MILGAHISTQGGIDGMLSHAQALGINAIQFFSHPPLQWQASEWSQRKRQECKEKTRAQSVCHIFLHGAYLINFASSSPEMVQKSYESVKNDLFFLHDVGGKGLIFHFGSCVGGWKSKQSTLVPLVRNLLEETPEDVLLIIENSAGSGHTIGATLEELALMKHDFSSPRIRFCLDTAHAFAAGYELSNKKGVDLFVQQVEQTIGWSSVAAVHLNDSRVMCGKKVDRHANIGEGYIGTVGLSAFVRHPNVSVLPLLLETPGNDGKGPDKDNVDRVKGFFTIPT